MFDPAIRNEIDLQFCFSVILSCTFFTASNLCTNQDQLWNILVASLIVKVYWTKIKFRTKKNGIEKEKSDFSILLLVNQSSEFIFETACSHLAQWLKFYNTLFEIYSWEKKMFAYYLNFFEPLTNERKFYGTLYRNIEN